MSDYWIDSPDNPFNQMDYTRGGGGYDNRQTHESNDRRAEAMQGAGAAALPHFATVGVAQAYYPGKGLAVVGGDVIRTTGPGNPSGQTGSAAPGQGGTGPGVATAASGGGGKGAGSRLAISGPLTPKLSNEITSVMAGGRVLPIDRGWSNIDAWEERYGDAEFGTPTWFATWGVYGADMLQGIAEYASAYRQEQGLRQEAHGGDGWATIVEAWDKFVAPNATTRVGTGGVHWKTGGGF